MKAKQERAIRFLLKGREKRVNGEGSEALNTLRKAIALFESVYQVKQVSGIGIYHFTWAHMELGLVLLEMEKYPQAQEEFQRAYNLARIHLPLDSNPVLWARLRLYWSASLMMQEKDHEARYHAQEAKAILHPLSGKEWGLYSQILKTIEGLREPDDPDFN